MSLTTTQEAAFAKLNEAMNLATDSGLFDQMAAHIHPDRINAFCDDLKSFEAVCKAQPQEIKHCIDAEVHDDGHHFKVEFDAALWFAQATDDQIIRLHGVGWAGDYPADEVAQFFESRNEEIGDLFKFCRATQGTRNQVGFECSVDEDCAMKWLMQNRPGLCEQLRNQDNVEAIPVS